MRPAAALQDARLSGWTALPPTFDAEERAELRAEWEQRAREVYRTAVEIPTVPGGGQMPKLANYLADQLRAAGWADSDIRVLPYTSPSDSNTAALIARWPVAGRPTKTGWDGGAVCGEHALV